MTVLIEVQGRPHVVQAVDEPSLVTISDVELITVGTWPTGVSLNNDPSGSTFTEDDLAAIVAAQDDPAIRQPRIKLGHTSAWGDAEPAFGTVTNMRLSDNGQTLIGDLAGVPAWLADVLPSVYPTRSVECSFFVRSSTGRQHRCVVTDVALLGVKLPAIGTLEDLAGIFAEQVPEGTEIVSAERTTAARPNPPGGNMGILSRRKAAAAVAVEDIRREYYESLSGDQLWWWIRAVYLDPDVLIVDDDNGTLYRVPFSVNGEDVTFSEPEEVKVQYVDASEGKPVTADRGSAVVYASRSESRPEARDKEDGVDPSEIRNILGLPESASDDEVRSRLAEVKVDQPTAETPETEAPNEGDDPDGESADTSGDEQEQESKAEPVAASDDTVTVDRDTWQRVQQAAQAGVEARKVQLDQERDHILHDAVKAGKFAPARLDHWRNAYDKDPEGTKQAIASLADGLIPTDERGSTPADQALAAEAYPSHWLTDAERQRAGGRVVQEVGD